MIPFKLWIAERISDDKDADIKGLFNSISLQPTTPYRQRIISQKKALGVPELEIDVRTYNAKLNTTLINLIKEERFGKGTIIQIQTTFGEVAYGMKPHIFRQENNITNPNITREYCSHEQNVCFQLMDQELYKRIIRHEGKLTQRILYRYVEDSTGVGISYIKSISGFKLYFSNDNGNQKSLDNYYEFIVKEKS